MKRTTKSLALLLALATSAAYAAGTPAGVQISNVATANFIDPDTNAVITNPVQSNLVQTTVLPKPDFDFVYADGSDGTTPTTPAAAYDQKNVIPGSNVDTTYTLVNLGNVGGQMITVTPYTNGSVTPVPSGSVEYYLGSVTPGNLITGPVAVPVDDPLTADDEGKVVIIQRIKVPANAPAGSEYSVSPRASGDKWNGSAVVPNTLEPDNDLQFTRASVITPSVVITPPTNPSPAPGVTPVNPDPANPDPNVYPDPSNPNIPISAQSNGNQDAYPPADPDTNTPDSVTFNSNVTNNGTVPDKVILIPPTGLPNGVTVTILDGNGTPIAPDANGNYPLGEVPAGGSVPYKVVVKYPDTDGNTPPPANIPIVIGVDSGNDPDLDPNSTATLTVHTPQQKFGDTVNPGGTADPSVVIVQTVIPGKPSGTSPTDSTDSTASFPVTIQNTGGYPERYTLVGNVPVLLTDVTTTNVPVVYYVDNNNDGVPDDINNPLPAGVTPSVPAGGTLNLVGLVNIPPNAASTTANSGNTPLIVTQTSTGKTSGSKRTDNNDQINVGLNNQGLNIVKSSTVANARPGDDLPYTITATNSYNAALKNFSLTEKSGVLSGATTTNIFDYSTFKTVVGSASFAGSPMYRFNNGVWQVSATPSANALPVKQVDVGINTNNDTTIDANDSMPSGGVVTVNFTTVVK